MPETEIDPGVSFGQVLEFVPLVEQVVQEVLAVRGTPVGATVVIPALKGIRVVGEEWDLAVTLTRRG
jgi:hypothetical protein